MTFPTVRVRANRTLNDVPTALRERACQYAHRHAQAFHTEASTAAWTLVFYKYIHARILKWPTLDRHKREELYYKLEDLMARTVEQMLTGAPLGDGESGVTAGVL